ncbi:MAG: asparaginase [Gemmatimonadota bacterium]|nr:MAG: asparaginase [Gemmatimonadota bacterium]
MSENDAIVEVTRGGCVESRHRVSAAVVDDRGQLLAWLGNPELLTFFRSAAKPLQALPLVTDGVTEAYEFSDSELAVCCASHSGEPAHIEAVSSILGKIGCSAADLVCGPHRPFYRPAAAELRERGLTPSRLHNNCSGKHAGMLAWSRHSGVEIKEYHHADHPVQLRICREIGDWTGAGCEALPMGIDGCGVPSFAQTLNVMAQAYARIVAEARREPEGAAGQVTRAMTTQPFYVGGTDRLTSRLMEVTGGRLLAKYGAESVYCLGDRERLWGIAVKVEDGDKRAIGPAVIELLSQLDLLSGEVLKALDDRHTLAVKNTRGEVVGEVRPNLRVQRAG